jgi:SAM-dependent methyltransferase
MAGAARQRHRVCPWWLGYFLACPLRRLTLKREEILAPYVREGMTVLEPGPGMGFFTLELARLVGEKGRVVALDVQPKMIAALRKKAAKQALTPRIDPRVASAGSMGVDDLAGKAISCWRSRLSMRCRPLSRSSVRLRQ